MSLDMSSRHSTGPEKKRNFGLCFVFRGSCFSAEESLPGTALPRNLGVSTGPLRAGSPCVVPFFFLSPTHDPPHLP